MSRRWRIGLASTALALLAAEVGWRIYLPNFASIKHAGRWGQLDDVPPEALRYRPHPYLSYGVNPNYHSDDGLNRHASPGFRGADFPHDKPAGEYRIVCVGGSTTYDSKIADWHLTWPIQLERALVEVHGLDHVRVLNAGATGYTSWDSLANVAFRVLDVDPDLVIVHHAMNDVPPRLVPPEVYRSDNTGYRRTWLEGKRWWDHSRLLHWLGVQVGFSARNAVHDRLEIAWPVPDPMARLDANPPVYFERNLQNIVALTRFGGAEVLLTTWAYAEVEGDLIMTPHYRRGVAEHNDVVRALARRHDVPFYDLAADMPQGREFWVEGRHNTERGARRKAELVAAWLADNLLAR